VPLLVVSLASGSLRAQSLEESYAQLCSKPAQAKTEACQILAKSLVAKLQAAEVGPAIPAAAEHVQTTTRIASPELDPALVAQWRLRWGPFADMVGKRWITSVAGQSLDIAKAIAGSGNTAVWEWEVPGEVLAVYQYTGAERKLALRIRWDQTLGGL